MESALSQKAQIFKTETKYSRKKQNQDIMEERTKSLIESIRSEFNRINVITKAGILLEIKVIENKLWITFRKDSVTKSLEIPLPEMTNNGLELLKNKDVIRVVCNFWLEREQKLLDYHEIMRSLLCEDVNTVIPTQESGSPLIAKIIKSFPKNQVSYMVNATQKLVNSIAYTMPLHETEMNSWAMNRRIVIIDPKFSFISDPNERLEYQVEKNKKYYDKFGWSAIGLSDGVLADKNYILSTDLRKITPFGEYHNPQRNLYSTLGMKGDELPKIRTRSMQKLIDKGITRKGWNLVTAILDVPLNFEDQILVDNRHKSLHHKATKRFIIYGDKLRVKKNEKIENGDVLGYSEDNKPIIMDLKCEDAKISSIKRDVAELNAEEVPITIIIVEGERYLRDGSKFSNLHGNKGIIRFIDLGHAIDPRTGEEIPIDVMISAKSINKRKNFGQIFEAIANNLNPGNDPIVVEDNILVEKLDVKSALKKFGYPEDGTFMIDTYCGEFQAIVGKMFWGTTKDPEDQLWEKERTLATNNRELRTSGLKFSHVEFKALTTRFGPNNPILKEILLYAQGVNILKDEMRILHSALGKLDRNYPVVDVGDIRSVNTEKGIFHTIDEIKGTIVDDEFLPDGFILKIPCYFQAIVDRENKENFTMGLPRPVEDLEEKDAYVFDEIFIPNALLRRCWRHGSGKWGLNTIGLYINHIVVCCHNYLLSNDINDENNIMRAVARYFLNVAKSMGTKRGELSTYGMSVRYPFSSRATAVLANNLPENVVEIHSDMANMLKVKTGDIVIAERFPCLGFMSIRPQFVRVTNDPQCKYVIRVSGNSLVSMNLDFDGDTLFLASFSTPEAILALRKEMSAPNLVCEKIIEQMNSKKVPVCKEMTLDDFEICRFPKPTNEEHAELVRKATGVKSHTGPVIALAYNLMRIVEKNVPYSNIEQHANLEVLLDFLGNTVFSQKHGIRSLQEEATNAICTADVNKMVELGFEEQPSQLLCDLIRKEAKELGIFNLEKYHLKTKENGGSKIINLIVRKNNRVYFATRSCLGPYALLDHLEDEPKDLPSWMLKHVLQMEKEKAEEKLDRLKAQRIQIKDILQTSKMKEVCTTLFDYIDSITTKKPKEAVNVL